MTIPPNPHPEQVEALRMQAFVDAAPDQRERIRRTFEQVAFERGIRPIDPPRLSSFTADVAVEAAERLLASLANRPADDGEQITPEDAWQELVERDDRTSPEEYPDMCLIERDELIDFMRRALPSQPEGVKRS